MLLLLPGVLYGAANISIGSSSVHKWLPDDREDRQRYDRFLQQFGTDQFVLISWEGCKLDDRRLGQFQEEVEKLPGSGERLIGDVQSTPQVFDSLTSQPLNLSKQQAARRLKGVLLGSDGLCVVIAKVTPHGLNNQAQTIEHIYRAADAVSGLGREQLRMAGTIYEAHAIDVASERSMRQLVIPSMLIGTALACVCLRSLWAAMAVLIMAGVGTLLAIASVTFTGSQFSAVLIVLPTLIFMLTLSSAVHLMHYYVDASAMHEDHLGSRAMLMGFKPTLLASLTTALGMASLTASQLSPIREFGLYCSLTLCLATAFLLLAFPALSDWFYSRQAIAIARRRANSRSTAIEAVPAIRMESPRSINLQSIPSDVPIDADSAETSPHTATELFEQAEQIIVEDTRAAHVSPLALRYTAWMNRHAIAISGAGLAMILWSLYGLMYLQPSTKFDDMFAVDSPTIRDMRWLEQNLGPIASVEILLHFPNDSSLSAYERIEWVDRISRSIRSDERLGVLSATTFLPDLPQSGSLRDVARRAILRTKLAQSLPMLAGQGWLANTPEGQDWRVTAKVSATSDEDYGVLTDRVAEQVRKVTRPAGQMLPFHVEITGLYPVMHTTQLALIDDLQISFTTAFLLITPVMMLIARRFWAGLLIMVPNVLPETLVFGCMAWLGFRLDIAGLLTASVAMGIAVNDTLHFVNWYARRLASGDSRTEAIADTLSCCAAAMFHTMLISCCSMLPMLFADFVPTRQFALLMIAMLSSALLGDLVLLPALLLSPLGCCLLPRLKQRARLKAAA